MRSYRLDRLELSVRNVDPAAVRAALAELGPALGRALGAPDGAPDVADATPAGDVRVGARSAPHALADAVAVRVAAAVRSDAGSVPRARGGR